MALPTNFGSWEHLAPIVRNLHNYRVRDFFRHQRYDKHSTEPRIDRPVNNILEACKIGRDDSAVIALLKIVLFEIVIGNAARLQPGIYGIPVKVWDEYNFDNRPKIYLYFEEDIKPTPDDYMPIRAEINIRLMDETPESMTLSKASILSNSIKAAFGDIPCWTFQKGKNIFTYQDKKLGYWLQIYSTDKAEAKSVVQKVLQIQNHTIDEKKLKQSSPERESDNTTGNHVIMGKTVRIRRYRPMQTVRFRYATLNIPGIDPIVLYDPYYRLNKSQLSII